ncbi:ANTAR domain-containing response regulator [Eubacterium oxidoreducens]|uniref:Response regulator NasT n=1 Tax=Eubacterium oxidoreducens TaxID=1732 RepID=A0A1G6ACB5_EUBOX|nr:ANTAR domain-containing protein [Eubacterium oxidoreducens]SDB05966.1 response regulator NasT [Eubacterium oxidoreducens]
MLSIVVAFPKPEVGRSIRNILIKNGYDVAAVCTTGGQAIGKIQDLEYGILISAYRFVDMTCEEMVEYVPQNFEMLLITSKAVLLEDGNRNIVSCSMPLKVHELLSTLEMMIYGMERRRKKDKAQPKKRSVKEQQIIDQAKHILMERNQLSEEQAHKYLQKTSMDSATSLTETAQMIISMMDG